MIARLVMLCRREVWEHRALVIGPAVAAGLLVLVVLLGYVSASLFKGIGAENIVWGLQVGGEHSATTFGVIAGAPALLLAMVLFFLVFFYTLDALYAERKDRSVLFWRSLPITDTETVISKLVTALVVAPLIAFVIALITQAVILMISTVFVWIGGGDASEIIWSQLPLAGVMSFSVTRFVGFSLWTLPFAAWFLFCSAFVKKSPFLWAVLPFALVPLLERLAFQTSVFAKIVWGHISEFWIYMFNVNLAGFIQDELDVDVDQIPEVVRDIAPDTLLTSPRIWGGLVVAAGLTALAIYVRRYRTEAES